ncbi:MAG: hypothetical protein Ct9H300mP19_17090 [Dehalococcoidia bacterium]|nr:MAG: hypothetical protein Ct9H300mP19_17090 [Dehalococcoidia bacterium]
MKVENLYSPENDVLSHFTENPIRAEHIYLGIVSTWSRAMKWSSLMSLPEVNDWRRFSDGLHQALEAKEGVNVQGIEHLRDDHTSKLFPYV